MTSTADAFDLLRSALERAGVRYAVGGSWASTAFGEPRFTNNVDILAEFSEENLPAFLRFLVCHAGRYPAGETVLVQVGRCSGVTLKGWFADARQLLMPDTWKRVPRGWVFSIC